MKIKVVIHEAEEGGYWAEVPAVPGCASQGETLEEVLANVHEAVEGCLSVDVTTPQVYRTRPGIGNSCMKSIGRAFFALRFFYQTIRRIIWRAAPRQRPFSAKRTAVDRA